MTEKAEKNKKTVRESAQIRKIRNSLLEQLENQGKTAPYYSDLVNDYIWYFNTRERIKRDVEERGVMISTANSQGVVTGYKTHDGIVQMNKITATMLKILHDLNLREPVLKAKDESDPSSYF